MSDVDRLRKRFAEIIAGDQHHGGRLGIEQRAAALADEALSLQKTGGAGERVRGSLYECAASFRSSAMWAAIDGRRFDDATVHMREAQALAEMSGDQAIKFRIWSHAGTMYRHLGRPADALAANDVARNLHLTRRDPLFACLGHARQAATLGLTRDTTAVRRALGCAQDTLERADPDLARPLWMTAVRNGAELETLALSAHLRLGDFAQAETHAHRSLALLHPLMRRDRAINTARLAAAQLGQGEVEDTHRHGDGRPRRHRLPARPGDPHAARFRGDPARHGTRHCLRTDLDPAGGRLENHRVNTVPLVSLACSPPTGHLPWRSPRPHGLSPGSVGQGEWVGER